MSLRYVETSNRKSTLLPRGNSADRSRAYQCGCCASPSAFLDTIGKFESTLDKLRDLPWTKPRQLTHPFEWTCSNSLNNL
jgi:hypothetical protein